MKYLGAYRLLRDANNKWALADQWAEKLGHGTEWTPRYSDGRAWDRPNKKAKKMIETGVTRTPATSLINKLDFSKLSAPQRARVKIQIAQMKRAEIRKLGKQKNHQWSCAAGGVWKASACRCHNPLVIDTLRRLDILGWGDSWRRHSRVVFQLRLLRHTPGPRNCAEGNLGGQCLRRNFINHGFGESLFPSELRDMSSTKWYWSSRRLSTTRRIPVYQWRRTPSRDDRLEGYPRHNYRGWAQI